MPRIFSGSKAGGPVCRSMWLMGKGLAVVLSFVGLTACSSQADVNRTVKICESTSRSFPSNQIDAKGDGLTDLYGSVISSESARYLVATGKLGFMEMLLTTGSYWRSAIEKNHPEIRDKLVRDDPSVMSKFVRIELAESDPGSCAAKEHTLNRYSMYLNGMRPDQCLKVVMTDKPEGRYLLSIRGKKNGPGIINEYILSDRRAEHPPLKVVSAWSRWSTASYPIFELGPSTACVADPNSVSDVFIAPTNTSTSSHLPPVVKVGAAEPVDDLSFRPINSDAVESRKWEEEYEPRNLVVATRDNRTLLLDKSGFVAHLDFGPALKGSFGSKVIALDAGVLLIVRGREGVVVSYLDPQKLTLRSFRAVVGDSGVRFTGHPGAGGMAVAYVRGNRLVINGRAEAIAEMFFEADLRELQRMLKKH